MVGSGGFLFLAALELFLMRLQLAIPENTFMEPYMFNRILSLYGATSIFFFVLPLIMGIFLYVAPLQVGRAGHGAAAAQPDRRALWVAGAVVLYSGFLWTPSRGRRQPAAAALRARLPERTTGSTPGSPPAASPPSASSSSRSTSRPR